MDELLSSINNFCLSDFKVTLADLQDIKPRFLHLFFEHAMREFEVEVEFVKKPHFTQPQNQFMAQYNLLTAIRTCFPFLDITLFDLFNAPPQRSIAHIKKVMDFLYFSDNLVEEMGTQIQPLIQMCQDLKFLLREKELCNQRKNELALEKKKKQQKMEDLEALVKEKQKEFQLINQEKNVLVNQTDEIKAVVKQKEQETMNVLGSMKSVESEVEIIRNQIMSKVDRIDDEEIEKLASKNIMVEEEKTKLEEKIKNKTNMKAQIQKIIHISIEKCTELEEVQNLVVEHSQLMNEKSSVEKQLQDMKSEVESLSKKLSNGCDEAQENIAEQIMAAAEEKLNFIEQTKTEKIRMYTDKVKEVKQLKDQINNESKELNLNNDEINNLISKHGSTMELFNRVKELAHKKREEGSQFTCKLQDLFTHLKRGPV